MRSCLLCLCIVVCCLTAPLAADAAAQETPPPAASEMMRLGLRGVYFVENAGQWSDESVHYGLRSRGLDVAFRESSFTMHLSREVSGDVPVAVARGAWASRPYESELVERASRPYESELVERASRPYESELVEWASRPFDPPIAPEASPTRERGFFTPDHPDPLPDGRGSLREPEEYEHLTLTITFPGSNPVTPRGAQPQTAKFNYFVGGEGRGTASNVPSFAAVVYESLYDGIDLHVTGNDDGVMKYEFHCAPGADYSQIRIHYDGIDSLCVNNEGDLEIATSFGTLRDGAPIVWQEDAGAQHDAPAPRAGPCWPDEPTIPARFELIDAATYRIALDAAPDPTLPLVIDPEIEWMYYLGGSGGDLGLGIAVDGAGNVLVTGQTWSTDFAGRNNSLYGSADAFAVKVSPAGHLEWMTYLGGSEGDTGLGIAVDGAGNALITGHTTSTDFAGRVNSHHGNVDAFLLKVNSAGQVQWMTYLGGSSTDWESEVALDGQGNALISGRTLSPNFEGRNNSHHGGYDAFVVKVNASGSLQWMSYLGGTGDEGGGDIVCDSVGAARVTGSTYSTDFDGRSNSNHGTRDAFALTISASGQLEWMTYLGGTAEEFGYGIDVDSAGNALVTGVTASTDFAGRSNSPYGSADAFAVKVSPTGQLMWMTYLGGSGYDLGWGIAEDGARNAIVSGETDSTDFVGQNNSHHGGTTDAFALQFNPAGQVQWMTYLGGSGSEQGREVGVDSAGNALVTGWTESTNFAGRNNSYYGGDSDTFILNLRLADGAQLAVAATCPSGGPIQIEWSGATPGGQAALIFARNTGSFIIPNNRPCAGTQLGLGSNQIQLAWQGGAGQSGSRTLNTTAGPGACGGYLQLLDLTPCATSNVARIE